MSNYFDNISENLKEYFNILSDEIPNFLYDYIETPEMQKQAGISVSCGTVYSKMYNQIFYSSLDHSVAVALIIWNFTKDKKQTLSGLFHDIATPAFKHCIDFMNKDYEKQESTEELTEKIIKNSKEIMKLLNKDNIKVEEIDNYHIYPIADNDTPRLASDRLEYTLSNGLGVTEKLWDLKDVKKIYDNIEVQKNEDNFPELGFKNKEVAEKFVHTMSKLSSMYMRPKTKFAMQFVADIIKKLYENNLITIDDLYTLSDKEVIEKIKKCKLDNISENYKIWENAAGVEATDEKIDDKYFVNVDKLKIRYINPLVNNNGKYERIKDISNDAKVDIERVLNYKTKKYIYIDGLKKF